MAFPHGTRVLGERHVVTCLAGSTIAKGDILQTIEATGSLTVDNAASNAPVRGIALQAIASAATGDVDSSVEELRTKARNAAAKISVLNHQHE